MIATRGLSPTLSAALSALLLSAILALTCSAQETLAPANSATSTVDTSPASTASDDKLDARFKHLAAELRCLVCQNQTLADSTAPLASDLRVQIKNQIAQGRSDDQIREFMVERYGDFILYKPPVKPTTWLLWAIPFVLLIGGLVSLLRLAARADRKDSGRAETNRAGDGSVGATGNVARSGRQAAGPSADRYAKAREWLDGEAD